MPVHFLEFSFALALFQIYTLFQICSLFLDLLSFCRFALFFHSINFPAWLSVIVNSFARFTENSQIWNFVNLFFYLFFLLFIVSGMFGICPLPHSHSWILSFSLSSHIFKGIFFFHFLPSFFILSLDETTAWILCLRGNLESAIFEIWISRIDLFFVNFALQKRTISDRREKGQKEKSFSPKFLYP